MKIILAGGAVLIVVMTVLLFVMEPANAPSPEVTPIEQPEIGSTTETVSPQQNETPAVNGKIKADMFTGKLEEVNTGCFADGECYVTVDGKHVTVIMGWSQETVGTIIGAPSIGDLESMIGKQVEVYAQENVDGTYTLYGDVGFYVKILN